MRNGALLGSSALSLATFATLVLCLSGAQCGIPTVGDKTFDTSTLDQQWTLTIQGAGAPVSFHLGSSGNGTLQSNGATGWLENVQGCNASPVPLAPLSGTVNPNGFSFTFNVMGCGYSYQGTGSASFTDGQAPAAHNATGSLRFTFALQGNCPQFCGTNNFALVATRTR